MDEVARWCQEAEVARSVTTRLIPQLAAARVEAALMTESHADLSAASDAMLLVKASASAAASVVASAEARAAVAFRAAHEAEEAAAAAEDQARSWGSGCGGPCVPRLFRVPLCGKRGNRTGQPHSAPRGSGRLAVGAGHGPRRVPLAEDLEARGPPTGSAARYPDATHVDG